MVTLFFTALSQGVVVFSTQELLSVAYPGLVKGGCPARIIFAHAQIVGRCGFERKYEHSRSTYVPYRA